jgi:hypothetical protein
MPRKMTKTAEEETSKIKSIGAVLQTFEKREKRGHSEESFFCICITGMLLSKEKGSSNTNELHLLCTAIVLRCQKMIFPSQQ